MHAHSENEYANNVQAQLEASGWACRPSSAYNAQLGMLADDLINFLVDTQPGHYAALAASPTAFLAKVRQAISLEGAAKALKHGVSIDGRTIRLCGFKPQFAATAAGAHNDHRHNRFSFVRELVFTPEGKALRLDFGLFLNGIPLFTCELKSELSNQSWMDAVEQYRTDRKPEYGVILKPVEGAIAHFAVSQVAAVFTTRLAGEDTLFLPFNPTYGYAKPATHAFDTDYLWRDVLAPDNVLDLLEAFIYQKVTETGKEVLFPRFHQWECIHRIKAAVAAEGPGYRYLQQHSAGSGKSNTIAWLASQLAYMTRDGKAKVFDKVLVVTDRLVLDRQLGDVLRFMHQGLAGQLVTCEHTKDLGEALLDKTPIVVTTLQKFSFLKNVFDGSAGLSPDQLARIRGLRFAVLIDEAHSSQGGEHFEALEKSLSTHLRAGRELPNVSFFAFTATPKNATLELFGRKDDLGTLIPFHTYSMQQAIDEGYILDVRKNYHPLQTLYHVESTRPGEFIEQTRAVFRSIFNDPAIVKAKAWEVVRVFRESVAPALGGLAQGMVVCDSRRSAGRFKQMLDALLAEQGLPWQTLCAFTDEIELNGVTHDEFSINGLRKGTDLAKLFVEQPDQYKLLVVAEKFQVGFDCPRLTAMFVDKPLEGLMAVQTLSRINRWAPGKTEDDLLVLDFVNDEEVIMGAFDRFIERRETAPRNFLDRLGELEGALFDYKLFTEKDLEAFKIAARTDAAALYAVLSPMRTHVREMEPAARRKLIHQLKEFKELFALGSKLDPAARKHQLLAGFVSRLLTTVDKSSAMKSARLPLKVVMAEVVPYVSEGAATGAEIATEAVVNGPAETKERKTPRQKALDGYLLELSAEKMGELAPLTHEVIHQMCQEPTVIHQARANAFDVFAQGSASATLKRLVANQLSTQPSRAMALMKRIAEGASPGSVMSNMLWVAYLRSSGTQEDS